MYAIGKIICRESDDKIKVKMNYNQKNKGFDNSENEFWCENNVPKEIEYALFQYNPQNQFCIYISPTEIESIKMKMTCPTNYTN